MKTHSQSFFEWQDSNPALTSFYHITSSLINLYSLFKNEVIFPSLEKRCCYQSFIICMIHFRMLRGATTKSLRRKFLGIAVSSPAILFPLCTALHRDWVVLYIPNLPNQKDSEHIHASPLKNHFSSFSVRNESNFYVIQSKRWR